MSTLDAQSLLLEALGSETLDALEADLAPRRLTLRLELLADRTVDAWIAQGLPGARSALADPADHVVAGLEMTLLSGEKVVLRPAPRRAVGPDLVALVVGAGGRFATVDRAWLRVHKKDARPVEMPLPSLDLDPPVSSGEAALLERIWLGAR